MALIKINKKRKERYTKYYVKRTPDGLCEIVIQYFIDNGNPVKESCYKYTKTVKCKESELPEKRKDIEQIILETRCRLIRSLRYMGASESNTKALLEQRMR